MEEKETKVTRIEYIIYDYLVSKYQCEQCGAKYIDVRDNFKYCPNCGRKIVAIAIEAKY